MKNLPKGISHIVTIGTTPPGVPEDVVDALIADLKPSRPDRVVVLATDDSVANADRLLDGIGVAKNRRRVRVISSAQSLDEAYTAVNEEITTLLSGGIEAGNIILHYTAGTKVMSAGAVLAAVNNDVQSLRYLFSEGRRSKSIPVTTPTASVLQDKQLRIAKRLLIELRFGAARRVIADLRRDETDEPRAAHYTTLETLASAYEAWDSFRTADFLRLYKSIAGSLGELDFFREFRISPAQEKALSIIGAAESADGVYPDELLIDLYNNVIRRLHEGRPDDAVTRLHRAAELYAQVILMQDYKIRTDDVDIRKIPPRSRTTFEAERRLHDAKIKIGLRKSYELLEILGHPIGQEYRQHERFQAILDERRNLVLAHGTRSASMKLAREFLREVEALMKLRIRDLRKRAAAQQFPWIDNTKMLKVQLGRS